MQTAAQSPNAGTIVTVRSATDASCQVARVRLEFLVYMEH